MSLKIDDLSDFQELSSEEAKEVVGGKAPSKSLGNKHKAGKAGKAGKALTPPSLGKKTQAPAPAMSSSKSSKFKKQVPKKR